MKRRKPNTLLDRGARFIMDPAHLKNFVPHYVIVDKNDMQSFLTSTESLQKLEKSLLDLLLLSSNESDAVKGRDIVSLSCGDATTWFSNFKVFTQMGNADKLYLFYVPINEYLTYISPIDNGWHNEKDIDEYIENANWGIISPNAREILENSQYLYTNFKKKLEYMNNVPLGFALLTEEFNEDKVNRILIEDFCTAFRVGRNMMRIVINDANLNGISEILLSPWEKRPALIEFYQSLGFKGEMIMTLNLAGPQVPVNIPQVYPIGDIQREMVHMNEAPSDEESDDPQ